MRPLITLATAMLMFAALGCNKSNKTEPPPYKGRVGVGQTTTGEIRDPRVQATALVEGSDEMAQAFAKDLAQMEEVVALNARGERATILMGDINNKTDIVSSDEFEMMRSRIRNTLLQSSYVKDKVRFVERRGRVGRIAESELGPQPDGAVVEVPSYDRRTAYFLNGDFYRIGRGSTNQYYMEFHLDSVTTGTLVFSKRYEVKQVVVK